MQTITLTGNRIFINPLAFDWNGQFLCEIGSGGQGPGEDMFLARVVEKNDCYYSMADKLIAYNSKSLLQETN